MRIAVIDLGTNTFNLLIADTTDASGFEELYSEKLPVKLGDGGINKGIITEAAFERGLKAMRDYLHTISDWRAERILAFATSAVRNASNGSDFVRIVKEQTGISIQAIDGDAEADFIARGVSKAVNLNEENTLIIDIGGGSTEFVILNQNQILWKKSFEIGASRLLQRFEPSDRISNEEKAAIVAYILESLEPLWLAAEKFGVKELVGASGSFESLAEIIQARFGSLPGLTAQTGCEFDLNECAEVHEMILHSTRQERLNMKGLIHMRVDMIVISAILVETVVSKIGIERIRYSSYSLKEGVLYAFLQGDLS
jgi:exopolyphosphatase / guanosine-5'-triphosphate,3'-diphosphate pyrophosphatase